MSRPKTQMSKEEKLAFLKKLIDQDDPLTDSQSHFENYIADPEPEVRTLALRGLWNYPNPELVDRLIGIARSDADAAVREQAISTLGTYVYEGEMADYDFSWGELEEMMREDELPEADYRRVKAFLLDTARAEALSLDERRRAVEALGFASDPEVGDLIEQAYQHPDLKMKASALFAMGRSGQTRWTPYVLAELNSDMPEVKLEAVRAAGEIYLDEASPHLQRLARQRTEPSVRLEAIWALGHMSDLDAWQLLDDLAHDPAEDSTVREVAEAALDEYHMFQQMDELAEDEDWDEDPNDDTAYLL